jgi:hypothetical protein
MKCPNCSQAFTVRRPHPENGCALAALAGVVADLGNKTPAQVARLIHNADVDALWTDLGPVIDKLEDGEYSS